MNIIPKTLIRRALPQLASVFLIGLLCLSGQANAAVSTFTDSASFFAALPGASSNQDFEGIPAGTEILDGSTIDGITYSSNVGDFLPGANLIVDDEFDTTSGNNYLAAGGEFNNFLSGHELSFVFSDLVQALGLFIIGSPGDVLENDFQLAAGGASVFNAATPERSLADGGDVFFLGLIDTDGFNSAAFTSFGDPIDPFFDFTLDDITTVGLDVVAVPEPSSFLLMTLGLFFLGKKWRFANMSETI